MTLYPLMVNLRGRPAVVVGGGPVGRRRAAGLVAAGARVRVIDPADVEPVAGAVHVREPYTAGHLAGAALVAACTDDRKVNAQIGLDARAAGAWVNIADDPADGDFTVPAIHRTEGLTVAVATTWGLPTLAATLRDRCAAALGNDVDAFAAALSRLRERLKAEAPPEVRRDLLVRLCGDEGLAAFRAGGEAALADLADRALDG
ncbi:MAG: precorrin-2 dehydrogenase/sirohydrochlorin ferrochelatase family protein [Planctomycetota bacterium]